MQCKVGLGVILAGVLVCASNISNAGMITYTFSGEIEFVDPALEFRFTPGDLFSGSLSFDPDAPVSSNIDAVHFYPTPIAVDVDGYGFSTANAYVRMNNDLYDLDYVEVHTGGSETLTIPLPGFGFAYVGLFLGTADTTLFDGSWQADIPPLTEFEYRDFTMYFDGTSAIFGRITSLSEATPTPEPSSLVLVLMLSGGAVGLMRYGRRRWRAKTGQAA